MKRIYLDNAATSWPKPDAVYTAVDRYLRETAQFEFEETGHKNEEKLATLEQYRKLGEHIGVELFTPPKNAAEKNWSPSLFAPPVVP